MGLEDKRTFLKLYILFYEANEINFFINSDYSIDNKNIVEKLLFDLEFTFDDIIRKETDLPKKERIILKKKEWKIINQYIRYIPTIKA